MSNSNPLSIPLANGVTSVPLFSGSKGQFEISLTAPSAPSAGTLKIEGLQWTGNYVTLSGATAIQLSSLASGAINVSDHGHFIALRFTIASLTGGTGPLTGAAYVVDAPVADLAFMGQRAMNVQTYNESSTKLGTQFYIQYQLPTLTGLTSHKILFQTGSTQVLVTDRQFSVYGAHVSVQVFKQPTGVSGGSAVTIQNYNDVAPATSTVTVTGGVTATGNGTAWTDPINTYGASQTVSRVSAGVVPGGNRVLKTNSSYLIVLSNLDVGTANVDYNLSWFEGAPDLPRS